MASTIVGAEARIGPLHARFPHSKDGSIQTYMRKRTSGVFYPASTIIIVHVC